MLPIHLICPECMDESEAAPLVLESHFQNYGGMFYPGEDPLGYDLEDEISMSLPGHHAGRLSFSHSIRSWSHMAMS